MDILIIALLALIASETSYLAYMARPKNKVDKMSLLIDTSVLIDGRILPIARSGLITAPMIIPRSVIRELQYMADKADHDKRERAREGLDMIEQLKQIESVTITVIDDQSTESGVDERLIELARAHGARLCTIDYNLNKAAKAQGVAVVNINELSHALRIIHLPGETVELKLVQAGQESRQAVGYLDDGTMVVVDDSKSLIGQVVNTEITRVLQTTAGKMMFARLVSDKKPRNDSAKNHSKTTQSSQVQTRGEGRMVAGDKATVLRTRGTANGRSRMVAQEMKEHEENLNTVASQELAPIESIVPASNQQNSRDSQQRGEPTPPRNERTQATSGAAARTQSNNNRPSQRNRHNNRRRTPEDSLVDLANE